MGSLKECYLNGIGVGVGENSLGEDGRLVSDDDLKSY